MKRKDRIQDGQGKSDGVATVYAILIEEIDVGERSRSVNDAAVKTLAESMRRIGPLQPLVNNPAIINAATFNADVSRSLQGSIQISNSAAGTTTITKAANVGNCTIPFSRSSIERG
jgi:hypothetical protein